MSKFIVINDTIFDVQYIKAVQKRMDVTDSYILRITDTSGAVYIELFETEKERDQEFDRIIAILNAV